ncbi:juvenile hormone acid O-methyltransferase-like [Schistocerca americana]|uniref:juvenile hormone acid O-methyltransferase-like n=1 Tax=Schistocerca americana TaxID=7009 RepID=UPI001F4F5A6D|nr:juvenile hormone acid O-methyltransferase-like [Schistocerca americana]
MDKPKLFSRDGAAYTAVAEAQIAELWSILSWPEDPLPVLDVGCGPGDVTKKVIVPRLPPGTKLVACDISPEMLEYCRQHNALPGTITYEPFDVMDPHVERSTVWKYAPYGKVFAVMLMHWVPDNRRVVQNMHKLLAPSGEAVFTIIANMPLFAAYEEMVKDPRWTQYMERDLYKFISPYQHCEDPVSVFGQLLKSEGFQVLRCDVRPQKFVFPSELQRRDALKSVSAFLNRIPEEQKDDFMEDWIQHMEKLGGLTEDAGPAGETKFYMHYNSMVAVGKKL